MEKETKNIKAVNDKAPGEKKISLPLLGGIIGAAIVAITVIVVVVILVSGGKKDNNNANSNNSQSSSSDGEVGDGILNEDNIDPDGWTKVDK